MSPGNVLKNQAAENTSGLFFWALALLACLAVPVFGFFTRSDSRGSGASSK